jgi:hypothetical protein
MQMVMFVLAGVTCAMCLSHRIAVFLTLYIVWYSRRNTTFQKVGLFTNFKVLTVTLLTIQVIRYMTLCRGPLDAEDKGTVILRNVARC